MAGTDPTHSHRGAAAPRRRRRRRRFPMLQPEFSVRIGHDSIDVTGDQIAGWSVVPGEDYRYASLEELVFALINLSLAIDADLGSA